MLGLYHWDLWLVEPLIGLAGAVSTLAVVLWVWSRPLD